MRLHRASRHRTAQDDGQGPRAREPRADPGPEDPRARQARLTRRRHRFVIGVLPALLALALSLWLAAVWGWTFAGHRAAIAKDSAHAVRYYRTVERLNPWFEQWRVRYNLGTAELVDDQVDAAVKDLERALKVVPRAPRRCRWPSRTARSAWYGATWRWRTSCWPPRRKRPATPPPWRSRSRPPSRRSTTAPCPRARTAATPRRIPVPVRTPAPARIPPRARIRAPARARALRRLRLPVPARRPPPGPVGRPSTRACRPVTPSSPAGAEPGAPGRPPPTAAEVRGQLVRSRGRRAQATWATGQRAPAGGTGVAGSSTCEGGTVGTAWSGTAAPTARRTKVSRAAR